MAQFDHFNLLGPIYDLIFGRSKNDEIVKLMDVNKGHLVLDVGGGTGRISVLLKKITANVFIADSAFQMIRQAQYKGIQTVNAASERLPFPAQSFDRIVMVDAFHHVEDQQVTLKEMFRLLAKDGIIIIEEPNIHNFLVKLIALGEKILFMRSHFVPPEKIVEMFSVYPAAKVEVEVGRGIARIIIRRK